MTGWSFRQWNNVLGWAVFALAFLVYLSTVEPTFSFWDTGEYISSAVKLEVTHAPGAALFQLAGSVAAFFAFGDPHKYGLVINCMSALFSALTILFLFWTISFFARKIILNTAAEDTSASSGRMSADVIALCSAAVGSLAFAFTDSFWFSAVEGEVYSMASMFIALILWLITKWDREADLHGNERWIILIFFCLGLSVGVHMMCMLVIPAVCLLYYARKYCFSWKSFLIANGITLAILALVFKFIFPFVMSVFGKTEIFFVNGLGMPFHSGTIAAFVLLAALFYFLIRYAFRRKNEVLKTAVLSLIFMLIGFLCWMVIPIRANANPPMNLNDPDNALGMLDYYNREQYGDWPTIYGQNYTAHLDHEGILTNEDGSLKTQKTGDVYEKDAKTGKYIITSERFNYVYNPAHVSFMPRMFSEDKSVMANYISMYGAPDFTFNYNSEAADSPEAQKLFEDMRAKYEAGEIRLQDYLDVKPYGIINVKKPSFQQNLDYFLTFQNGYYFLRYLMWNFVGKQNDFEGHQEVTNGNWISGISFIDDAILGDQSKLPAKYTNSSTTKFYFIPFLLAVIGLIFHANNNFKRFYALLALFVLTSVGIVFYTGVKPFEPRERDYAMVGAFFTFAIWLGLGVTAILYWLSKYVKQRTALLGAGILLLGVPFMMGFQNYNAHDRSGRSAAYDYSYSMLQSLPKNNILFVYADNDTYPVWAIQETEKFRRDVKVVNFTLLATPWNIDQVKRKTYDAPPVPGSLTHDEYRDGVNDQIVIMNPERWKNFIENNLQGGVAQSTFAPFLKYMQQDSMTVQEAINFIKWKSTQKDEIQKLLFGEERYEKFNFLPVSKFVIPVNKANAIKAGIVKPADASQMVDHITVEYDSGTMFKNNLLLLDILANFNWNRTINFSNTGIYEPENIFYLDDYLQYDGFSYRLVPIRTEIRKDGEIGRADALTLYNTVKNFRWGSFDNLNNHYDETATSNIYSYRNAAARAADALSTIGQTAKAQEVLRLAMQKIPVSKYREPKSMSNIIYAMMVSGMQAEALKLAEEIKKEILKENDYYNSLPDDQRMSVIGLQRMKPKEYALVTAAVTDGYDKIGQKQKGYEYLVQSLQPIDKKFNNFIANLQTLGAEKAYEKAKDVQQITPYYTFMFDIMKPYDSTYAKEKEQQITQAIMKVTQ